MMKEGIGPGKTREDHNNVFMQLYSAYAEGCDLREISTIVGTDALSDRDKVYLEIADRFENEFIAQGENQKRTIEETLDIGWKLFASLPEEDLKLVSQELIKKYLPKYRNAAGNR
jgi:V/A-type H+-transporting ATPase subunit B